MTGIFGLSNMQKFASGNQRNALFSQLLKVWMESPTVLVFILLWLGNKWTSNVSFANKFWIYLQAVFCVNGKDETNDFLLVFHFISVYFNEYLNIFLWSGYRLSTSYFNRKSVRQVKSLIYSLQKGMIYLINNYRVDLLQQ